MNSTALDRETERALRSNLSQHYEERCAITIVANVSVTTSNGPQFTIANCIESFQTISDTGTKRVQQCFFAKCVAKCDRSLRKALGCINTRSITCCKI